MTLNNESFYFLCFLRQNDRRDGSSLWAVLLNKILALITVFDCKVLMKSSAVSASITTEPRINNLRV